MLKFSRHSGIFNRLSRSGARRRDDAPEPGVLSSPRGQRVHVFNASQLIEPVSMIVLTGGPCSGKSSSLAYLTEKLSNHGFMVFVVPETATLITTSGIDRRKMDGPKQVVMYEE